MQFEDVTRRLDKTGIGYVVHEHEPNLAIDAVERHEHSTMDVTLKTMVIEGCLQRWWANGLRRR